MNAIFGLGLMAVMIIIALISTIATLIIGVTIANYLGLSGIVWWAFIIVFWGIVSSLISKSKNR